MREERAVTKHSTIVYEGDGVFGLLNLTICVRS